MNDHIVRKNKNANKKTKIWMEPMEEGDPSANPTPAIASSQLADIPCLVVFWIFCSGLVSQES